ncbi:MAG: prolyl oligopeptidase family serine peptidase [Burkholderiales bacterium]
MRITTRTLLVGAIALLDAASAWAANGDILERTAIATGADATFVAERVVYESDGLRIVGFLAYPAGAPAGAARLPCVLFNRGGNRDFGATTPESFLNRARRVTGWGYVLFASNYRGSPGSEGKDEFGGDDVNDVHNALHVFDRLPFADRDRIGMWGHSRGGMMTYIALTTTDRVKAAVIGAGSADLERWMSLRPEMETEVAAQMVPDWATDRAKAIAARSAVRFVDRLPANVPILLVHGTADWRVDPRDSMDMAKALYATRRPFSLLLFEGADHAITERRDEYYQAARAWMDRYVRDRGRLPDLAPHGT